MNRDQKIVGVGKTLDYRKKIIHSQATIYLSDHYKYLDNGIDKPLTFMVLALCYHNGWCLKHFQILA